MTADPRVGRRVFDLTAAEWRSLPIGTRAAYRQGVYAGDYVKLGRSERDHRPWFGEEGRVDQVPGGAVITDIPGIAPPPPPPPTSSRPKSDRRRALERMASGNAGASASEMDTARKELNRMDLAGEP